MTRRALAAAAALVCACGLAAAALPATGGPQSRPNVRDQATARHAVVQLSDFVAGSGWSGGPLKTGDDPAATAKCRLSSSESDLVETGDASSSFKYRVPIVAVVSNATLYRTEQMARLSWQRARPQLAGYLRCIVSGSLPADARFVSVKPLGLPRIGAFGGAYRITFDVSSGGTTVRMVTDVAVFGSGRALLMLMQLSPAVSAGAAMDAEVRLGSAMLGRVSGLVA
jgi:hypothetical protein